MHRSIGITRKMPRVFSCKIIKHSNISRRRVLGRRFSEKPRNEGINETAHDSGLSNSDLIKLCAVSSVPFIGFGIADNGIMIIAGDFIDRNIGMTLGISTLAAAGLGNLISDICGLGVGDTIERWCHKLGLREPNMSVLQQASSQVARTRKVASVIGISVGCLIGMLPLMFITDRKKLYFEDKELALFESSFQPFGVTPADFFELMRSGVWRKVEPNNVIARSGEKLDRVLLVHSGSAKAYKGKVSEGNILFTYKGRSSGGQYEIAASEKIRGSIIGGSALVDPDVLSVAYPNTIVADDACEFVEWNVDELREQMKDNKSVEAAVFSILYLDLVEGLKQQARNGEMQTFERDEQVDKEFNILIKAVTSDGMIHASERQLVREFMATHDLPRRELLRHLEAAGWTKKEWDAGKKHDMIGQQLQERIKEIPGMLRHKSFGGGRVPQQDTISPEAQKESHVAAAAAAADTSTQKSGSTTNNQNNKAIESMIKRTSTKAKSNSNDFNNYDSTASK